MDKQPRIPNQNQNQGQRMSDVFKPITVSMIGIGVQYTDIDFAIKIIIGLMTIYYLGLKIVAELKRRKQNHE